MFDFKRKSNGEDSGECDNKKSKNGNSEENITRLIEAVLSQGLVGNLVIILQDDMESPYVTLQNSVSYINLNLAVVRIEGSKADFALQINGEEFAKGTFQNLHLAKKPLAEQTLQKLKETCFFIHKKKDYVNVTKENLHASTSASPKPQVSLGDGDSIAHKIMTKMGWTGGGLGAQEQGILDSITLSENVNRLGLGSHNLASDITKKLEEFSKSSNLLSLVFGDDFTKEERALIHKTARKFNLKSKSTGTESRRLTVSKRITRIDIVKELLKIGGEDGLYKLHVPTKFEHLW